jgi:hypothetical protein
MMGIVTPETEVARLPEELESSQTPEEQKAEPTIDASFMGIEESETAAATEPRELGEKLLRIIEKYADSAIFLPSAEGRRISFDDEIVEDAAGDDTATNGQERTRVEDEAEDLAHRTLARLGIEVKQPR